MQHSISDYICICENGWEGDNCQTAAIVATAANVGENSAGAAVTGGVVIFLLLVLIVIARTRKAYLQVTEFSEGKQAHVGMEASKTNQTRWD